MSISEPQAGQTGEPVIPWQLVHDRYRIVRELGTGAFGTVFVADDEQTPRRVAIRVLPPAASAVPNVARIIQNTSRSIMAAPTSHPSLVGVLEVGEVEPGRVFIVTELVEGRRLSEILAAGNPLDFDPVRKWVLDLGGAIEVLHNLGLLHGAIRPRNVMLLADGRVKLMDIELAGLRDTPTLRDDKAPAEYLAPEQTGKAPWTEKADTYAFGLLVYDVFCGGPPFQASTLGTVVAKQPNGTPAPMRRRRALPASMESIVMQALEKDPYRRPWMHEMLNSLWGETTVPVPSNGAPNGSIRWKRVAMFVGSAVAAAASVVLTIWGLSGLQSLSRQSAASAPSVSLRIPSASPTSRSESATRPAAAPQAVAPPAAPVSAPPSAAKPTLPTAAAPQPPVPQAAVSVPPAKSAISSTPAEEARATTPPASRDAATRAIPPDTRPSARTAAVALGTNSSLTAVAEPQAEKRIYRVGWLDPGRVSSSYQDIVRQSLVGYPREIAFEYRYAGGRVDRLPELATELVHLKVDVVFAVGNQASQAAKQATSTIPIVIVGSDAGGASGNVTGVTYASSDLARSWLRLLKEMRPGLSRVAVLYAVDASSRGELATVQGAAANAGVTIQAYPLHEGDALGSLLARPAGERAEAIVVPGGPAALVYLPRLIDLANRARIPAVYGSAEFAEAGGLVAYGPSTPAIYRRAGAYIGKILGPTNPRDLPVEEPSRSELVVNLKTARTLGLTLPESLVRRADRVLQ
jgi:putative tryptophan/tyrosine transport system substrate-binding protein